jgi:hypothetical protein
MVISNIPYATSALFFREFFPKVRDGVIRDKHILAQRIVCFLQRIYFPDQHSDCVGQASDQNGDNANQRSQND